MSKVNKFCAHLYLEDGTSKDLNVQIIKRISRHKFHISVKVKANKLNKSITICRNGKVEVEVDAPKTCPSGCDCDSFSLNAEL